jgi:hydroxymethylglutaryl-CoA lyase
MAGYPKIYLTEEGMRDGLQIESPDIPVAEKIRLLDALSETGLKEIAVGAFVSPRWTPQMAEVDDLVRGFHPRPGVRYTYTALNDRGVERARAFTPPLSEPLRLHGTSVHLCDVFVQRNANRTQAQEIARWPDRIARAKELGATEGGIGLGAAWGSNWTGEFTLEQRMQMLDRQVQLWDAAGITVTRVDLADPMSWNMPHHVERQLEAIKLRWPSITDFNLHLHNGRGMALPSTYAALRVLGGGDTLRLQSAIGGMAGCPYCGNGQAAQMMATEDLVHMLEDMGISTGVDLYRPRRSSATRSTGSSRARALAHGTIASIPWTCRASRRSSRPAISSSDPRCMKKPSLPGRRPSRAGSVRNLFQQWSAPGMQKSESCPHDD